MFLIVLIMLLVCIGIPLAYTWRILRLDLPSKGAWLLLVADAAVFVALVLLVGRWDMAGYYTRFVLLAFFAAAVLWSLRKHVWRPWIVSGQPTLRKHWPTLVSLVFFGGALGYVTYGMLPNPNAHELTFPLRDGRFMTGQAGNISLLNHHAGHREQGFAADIVAINPSGYRADGLAPEELESFVIYGAPVVSPCTGIVVATRDNLPDLIPPETDPDNARGNHVIIDCGELNVELAHLQFGSVSVTAGSPIAAEDLIGKVGNSGNTTEPHLHMHVVDPETRAGIPMSFMGRQPVRNRLYVN